MEDTAIRMPRLLLTDRDQVIVDRERTVTSALGYSQGSVHVVLETRYRFTVNHAAR